MVKADTPIPLFVECGSPIRVTVPLEPARHCFRAMIEGLRYAILAMFWIHQSVGDFGHHTRRRLLWLRP